MIQILWFALVASAAAVYPSTYLNVSVCSTNCYVSWGTTQYFIADFVEEYGIQRLYYQTDNTLQTLTIDIRSNGTVGIVNDNCFCQSLNCSVVMCPNPTRFFHFEFSGTSCINTSTTDFISQQLHECVCFRRGCEVTSCCPPDTTITTTLITTTTNDTQRGTVAVNTLASSGSSTSNPGMAIGITLGLGLVFIVVVIIIRRNGSAEIDPDFAQRYEEPLYAEVQGPPHVPPRTHGARIYDEASGENQYLDPHTNIITEVTTNAPLYDTGPPSPSNIYDLGSNNVSEVDENEVPRNVSPPPVYNMVRKNSDNSLSIINPLYDNTLERNPDKHAYLWVGAEEETYDPRTITENTDGK